MSDIGGRGAGADTDGPQRSTIHHYSLMNSLLTTLNSSDYDSSEHVLAQYFLDRFDRLEELNVYDVAEECYTSRTGIRRFCQSIGLDNFSDLKSYAWEWQRHRNLYVSYAEHDGYSRYLASAIADTCRAISASVEDNVLDDLALVIRHARCVLFLTSGFSSMAVEQFQRSMLYFHKLVRIVTDSTGDVSQLSALKAEDAIFVLSEHGGYAQATQGLIDPAVMQVLITVDCPEDVANSFDIVVRIADCTPPGTRSVYAQYGVSYLLDLLCNRYSLLDRGESPAYSG